MAVNVIVLPPLGVKVDGVRSMLCSTPGVTVTVVVGDVTGPKLAVTSDVHTLEIAVAGAINPVLVPTAAHVWLDDSQMAAPVTFLVLPSL